MGTVGNFNCFLKVQYFRVTLIMAKTMLVVMVITLAIGISAKPADNPTEDAPQKIDFAKAEIATPNQLNGKFFGLLSGLLGGYGGYGGYGGGYGGYGGLGYGGGYNNAFNRNHYQSFHHTQQSSSTSYNSGSNLGYYGGGYNRFYRSDGTMVTDPKEIAEFAASMAPQDDTDAQISE